MDMRTASGICTTKTMTELLEEYRLCCNLLTDRIEEINFRLRQRVPEDEFKRLSSRRRLLREERLELLCTMRVLQEYCR
ncbi:MAG: hypothetical protein J6B17_00570 [Ruminococcus sp.]|nr:hypothetical protein [Ruminococcus sp.]